MSAQPGRPIRVLVVDDHPVLRDGVMAIMETEPDMILAGEAASGEEAVTRFTELRPDVTLMDLKMPGKGGIWAISTIRRDFPSARILVLTTYEGDIQAAAALKAGAAGYLLKSSLRRELLDTIRAIAAGRRHIPAAIAQEIAIHAADDVLSEREVAVLRLVAEGHANKEIGHRLFIAEETVKTHMKSIFAKLDVADRTLAVITALRRGMLAL